MKRHTVFSDIASGLSLCSIFALLIPIIFPVLAFLDGAKADYQVFAIGCMAMSVIAVMLIHFVLETLSDIFRDLSFSK